MGEGTDGQAQAAIGLKKQQRLRAIGLISLAVLCFTFLDTTAKYLVQQNIPAIEVVWARYVGHALIMLIFINPWSVKGLFHTKKPWLQFIRSLLLFAATFSNFIALKYLQLAETMSIIFATPLIVAVLAGVFLGQWIGRHQWLAIGIGFAGVLVITRPGFGDVHWAVSLSCFGALSYAGYNLLTRVLATHDRTTTTLVYSSLAGALLLTPAMPSLFIAPSDLFTTLLLVTTGLWGLIGHWLLIAAHRHVSAQDLSPFIYTQIVWMTLAGWLVFGDVPGLSTFAGALVVVASGLYLLWAERHKEGV